MADLLDHRTIDQLRQLAVEAGLDAPEKRDFLMAGINRQFVAQLPRRAASGDQLYSDLLQMQNVTLQGGEVPLLTWLANAVHELKPRVQAATFTAALEQVAAWREHERPVTAPQARRKAVRRRSCKVSTCCRTTSSPAPCAWARRSLG